MIYIKIQTCAFFLSVVILIMPRPTTRATKPGRGRPKASSESCAPSWYAKKRPSTTLKKCVRKSQTCKSKAGESGLRCQTKSKRGRPLGSKNKSKVRRSARLAKKA